MKVDDVKSVKGNRVVSVEADGGEFECCHGIGNIDGVVVPVTEVCERFQDECG
jgi:hypothetical protein